MGLWIRVRVAAKRLGASMACQWTVRIWDNVVHGLMTWMRVSGSSFWRHLNYLKFCTEFGNAANTLWTSLCF